MIEDSFSLKTKLTIKTINLAVNVLPMIVHQTIIFNVVRTFEFLKPVNRPLTMAKHHR